MKRDGKKLKTYMGKIVYYYLTSEKKLGKFSSKNSKSLNKTRIENKIINLLDQFSIEFEKSLPKSKDNAGSFRVTLSDLFVDYFNPEYNKEKNDKVSLNLWLNSESVLEALKEKDFYNASDILVEFIVYLDNMKEKILDLKKSAERLSDICFDKAYSLNKDHIEKTRLELFRLMDKILNEKSIKKKKESAKKFASKYRANELILYSGKKKDKIFFFIEDSCNELVKNKKREKDKILAKELESEIKDALKNYNKIKK